MPRTLPCPPQPLTCIGDVTGYGILRNATMQRVGRNACEISTKCVVDSVNSVSCEGGVDGKCSKAVSKATQKTILEESDRLIWTLFIVVACHVQCESTLTVSCVQNS